ncbi:hypothetical protein ACJX0J_006501 [Zea mays]
MYFLFLIKIGTYYISLLKFTQYVHASVILFIWPHVSLVLVITQCCLHMFQHVDAFNWSNTAKIYSVDYQLAHFLLVQFIRVHRIYRQIIEDKKKYKNNLY